MTRNTSALRVVGMVVAVTAVFASFTLAANEGRAGTFYGVTAAATEVGGTLSEQDWDRMEDLGVEMFRLQISWDMVNEGGPNMWVNVDDSFREASERGIELMPMLYANSDQPYVDETGAPDGGPDGLPDDKHYAQRFPMATTPEFNEWAGPVNGRAAKLVRRYGFGGDFWAANPSLPKYPASRWVIWNEPNFPENRPIGANAQDYGIFLEFMSKAIRDQQAAQSPADASKTKILFGGLASARFTSGNNSPCTYLTAVLTWSGAVGSFDALAIHPYGFVVGSPQQKAADVIYQLFGTRNCLEVRGMPNMPIYINEVGWPLTGSNPAGSVAARGYVTEQEQSDALAQAFTQIHNQRQVYGVEHLSWYILRDICLPKPMEPESSPWPCDIPTGVAGGPWPAGNTWAHYAGLYNRLGSIRTAGWAYAVFVAANQVP